MKKLKYNGDFVELKLHNHFVKFELWDDQIKISDYLGYDNCTSETVSREEARRQYKNYRDQSYSVHKIVGSE